ncbi:MAG: hypothetical protein JWM99_3122 [Verrucomicrobiales bacterium]|nr:hypothetical protein [Verrucomicrobiales bacterium]
MRIAILLVLLCVGCATHPLTSESVAKKTIRTTDGYRKSFEIVGPLSIVPIPASQEGLSAKTFLRAGGEIGGPVSWYDIVVVLNETDWVLPKEAVDRAGQRFEVHQGADRSETTKLVTDQLWIDLDRDYLNAAATRGLNFRISGEFRNQVVIVSPEYVRGFLLSVDSGK